MVSALSRLFIARASADAWERGRWRGRLVLYTLAFTGSAVSLASVAWASDQVVLFMALMIASGVGHAVSGIPSTRRVRLSFFVYPAVFAALWMMRGELLPIFLGGSLFPLAKLLAFAQVLVSFNLRSMRTLYDALLLSLATILVVSEGAMSVQFGVFLLAFGVVALGFLAAAYPVGELQHLRLVASSRMLGVMGPVIGIVVLTAGVSVAAFLIIPQTYRVRDAGPLPSRLDLTAGRPAAVPDIGRGGTAPAAGIIPSRDGSGAGDAGDVDDGPPSSSVEEAGVAGGSVAGPQEGLQSTEAARESSEPGGGGPSLGAPSAVNDYVALGYQGEDEKDVVMYVRSPLASYWRGQVLDQYDGRGWVASESTAILTLDRSGGLVFRDSQLTARGTGLYVQSFYSKVTQANAVFTGYSPGRIANQDSAERGNERARVLENVRRLQEAGAYRVVSAIPTLSPETLRGDFVDGLYLLDVDMPDVPARVRDLASSIVAGARTDYDRAALLEQYLLASYAYDLRVSPFSRSGDVVDSFLFERQAGYCSQFATAMAVMARLVGLPARVATGYLPGEYNSMTGAHVVRLRDAHAWVEIKFRNSGWVPFDPTPRPDSPWALDVGYVEATRGVQQAMRAQLKDLVVDGPSSALRGTAALFGAYGPAWLAGAVLAAALLLVGAFLTRRSRARARRTGPEEYSLLRDRDREAVRKAYSKAVKILGRKGYPVRQAHQGPVDYVLSLKARGFHVPAVFYALSRITTQALYDPSPMDGVEAQSLTSGLRALRRLPKATG